MSLIRVLYAAVVCLLLASPLVTAAEKPNGAQKQAASEYLDAVASGSPQAVAYAIHPAELEGLRTKILSTADDIGVKGKDVYSNWGRINLYRALTGQPAFDAATLVQAIDAVCRKDPLWPSAHKPELGPAVDAVFQKALAKQPNQRFSSAGAFAEALVEALHRPSLVAAPPACSTPSFRRRDRTCRPPRTWRHTTSCRSC